MLTKLARSSDNDDASVTLYAGLSSVGTSRKTWLPVLLGLTAYIALSGIKLPNTSTEPVIGAEYSDLRAWFLAMTSPTSSAALCRLPPYVLPPRADSL